MRCYQELAESKDNLKEGDKIKLKTETKVSHNHMCKYEDTMTKIECIQSKCTVPKA